MCRTQDAIKIAQDCLAGQLSPLQAASKVTGLDLTSLPCWEETGAAHGPLWAFYGAADAADRCHFLGKDVERWAPAIREQKRSELLSAEDHWRDLVDQACRALISCMEPRR